MSGEYDLEIRIMRAGELNNDHYSNKFVTYSSIFISCILIQYITDFRFFFSKHGSRLIIAFTRLGDCVDFQIMETELFYSKIDRVPLPCETKREREREREKSECVSLAAFRAYRWPNP